MGDRAGHFGAPVSSRPVSQPARFAHPFESEWVKINLLEILMKHPKTTYSTFYSINPARDKLFAVEPGISVVDALETVGCLLSAAIDIIYKSEPPPSMDIFGAAYLAEFAKGTVDACISDLMKGGRS